VDKRSRPKDIFSAMKIITWNVNGLRAAINKGSLKWVWEQQPDVLCLQEIKARPDQLKEEQRHFPGYDVIWNPAEKAGYSGVATFLKSPSLELLSMRHVREADALTVTGLVRNGGSGSADRLIAVVFAFDRSGNFLASGRAPIDFLSLAPGDESPFKVSVPNAGEVGRYRVSFRTEAGVVKHVDRRQSLLARQGE